MQWTPFFDSDRITVAEHLEQNKRGGETVNGSAIATLLERRAAGIRVRPRIRSAPRDPPSRAAARLGLALSAGAAEVLRSDVAEYVAERDPVGTCRASPRPAARQTRRTSLSKSRLTSHRRDARAHVGRPLGRSELPRWRRC